MNVNDIAARIQAGAEATDQERALLIRNNPFALAAFMIDNNPGSVNLALCRAGYDHLGFEPKKEALARQLEILIERGDVQTFGDVVRAFNLIPDMLSPAFVNELRKQFAQ